MQLLSSTSRQQDDDAVEGLPDRLDDTQHTGAMLWCCFVGAVGAIPRMGVFAFHQALQEAGMFAGLCEEGQAVPCYRQKVATAQALTFIVLVGPLLVYPLMAFGMPRLGAIPLLRLLLYLVTVSCGLVAVWLRYGVSFVVGMSIASVAGNGVTALKVGPVVRAAALDEWRDRWGLVIAASAQVSPLLAPLVALLFSWRVLPLWAWYLIFAGAFGVVFITWFELAVAPLERASRKHQDILSSDRGKAGTVPPGLWRFLRSRHMWIASLQMCAGFTTMTSFTSASVQTAPWFGWDVKTATFFAPVCTGAVALLFVAKVFMTSAGDNPRLLLAIRTLAIAGMALAWGLPAARTRAGLFVGLSFAALWGASSLASGVRSGAMVGHGGAEAIGAGFVSTLNAIIGLPVGLLATYCMGYSPQALSVTVLTLSLLGLLVEWAAYLSSVELKEAVRAHDEGEAPPSLLLH